MGYAFYTNQISRTRLLSDTVLSHTGNPFTSVGSYSSAVFTANS